MARRVERAREPRRRGPFREPRSRVLVLCCGEVTEPEYFNGLKQNVRNPSVTVKVQVGKSADPASLVAEARRRLERDDFDEIWCVADVDRFEIGTAVRNVRSLDSLQLALSNPCFELWLLLHFEDWRRSEPECGNLVDRLRQHVADYDKHVDFTRYSAGVDSALDRARRLINSDDPVPNPSTDVWRLVDAIRRGSMDSR